MLVACCVLALAGSRERKPQAGGPVLSESSGELRDLVIHYAPTAREMVLPVYSQLFRMLEKEITVYVVCPDASAFDDLRRAVGLYRCRLKSLPVHHPITTWSRDRWLALGPVADGRPTILWAPRGEAGAQIWPTRAGDELVAGDIACASGGKTLARRSRLYFEAGDFFADDQNVFIAPRVVSRNLQQTVSSRGELIQTIAAELKRRPILLDEAPDHHAAMFMASIGGRVMLVGDPGLARTFLPAGWAAHREQPGAESWQPDFSAEAQRLFDAVARQCATVGYRVVRVPTVPGIDGKSYLTYVNVLMDFRGGRKIVYLPCYAGLDALNDAASQIWRGLGFEVRPVDCTTTYRHFGCLHCLVNVLTRSPSPADTAE